MSVSTGAFLVQLSHVSDFVGPYCHCLLAARRIGDCRPYLDRLQCEQYSISAANCHVLQGLYSGHYYAECLHFFKGLVSLDHSGQLLGNPTSVHTALKAAYQLKEFKTVLEIFDLMQKRDMRMVRPVVFMVAEVWLSGVMSDRFTKREISGGWIMSGRSEFCGRMESSPLKSSRHRKGR